MRYRVATPLSGGLRPAPPRRAAQRVPRVVSWSGSIKNDNCTDTCKTAGLPLHLRLEPLVPK